MTNIASPCVNITPDTCLVDDTWNIVVRNLRPGQEVTLVCRTHEDGVRFCGYAHYVADGVGVVSLENMPSLDGTYTGVEPMGLIWSQSQEPGQKPGRRLTKSDVTVPMITIIYVLNTFHTTDSCLDSIAEGRFLAHASCKRCFMREGVQRHEVREGRLRGTLFIPAGSGPFPGVVDLFGTVGGTVEHRSALLASRGIASLSVQYFTPGRGEGMIADIEYFEQGIDYLLKDPNVMKPFVGIIGVSKGAEMALIVSALCHKIKACVTINGVDIFTLVQHTYQGVKLPSYELSFDVARHPTGGVVFKHLYTFPLEEREPFQIPVERAECEFLLIHGEDDQSMPVMTSEHVAKRLRKYNKCNHRLLIYPGAGHLLEPPHSPFFFATHHAMFNGLACWGGTPREHTRAQEAAWAETLQFLKLTIPKYCKDSVKNEVINHKL